VKLWVYWAAVSVRAAMAGAGRGSDRAGPGQPVLLVVAEPLVVRKGRAPARAVAGGVVGGGLIEERGAAAGRGHLPVDRPAQQVVRGAVLVGAAEAGAGDVPEGPPAPLYVAPLSSVVVVLPCLALTPDSQPSAV
jgi:hypothetical protein